ncbi:hypothetical protein FJZ40_05015 [Candidatus Shapirobacteria bacterium]|nr:hypothetical protein [Candidatus Shapirobacteria bacterium]
MAEKVTEAKVAEKVKEAKELLSPEEAREQLTNLGYDPDRWSNILRGHSLHVIKALITIARGTEPKLPGQVYAEMRVKDRLPADRLAGRAGK